MKYFIDTEFLEGTQYERNFFGHILGETKPTIDLISIGIVAEDGREYYAISKYFNLKEAWNRYDQINDTYVGNGKNYWIRDNVLKPIYYELCLKDNPNLVVDGYSFNFSYKNLKRLINKYGKTNKQIAEEVKEFVICDCRKGIQQSYDHYNSDGICVNKPEFYGYYSDYDWVVFCWLFGKMIDLPKGFPMYCIDLKQELDIKANSMTTMEITDVVFGKGYMKHDVYKYADEKYPQFNVTKINSLMSAANYTHPELKQTNKHNALADAKWNYKLYKFLEAL